MVKKGKFRKLILSILPALALVGLLPTQQVEAAGIFGDHNRVFMGVLLDASRNSVYIDPIIDDGAMKEDDWVANSQITATADKGQPVWYCGGTGENNGKCHYLSFPGSDYSKARLYNQTDQDLADNVASVMTTSFSSLIQKCAMMDDDGNFTADEYYETVANIANARTNGDLVTNTFTIDCGGSTGHLEVAPAPDYIINSSGVNMGTTIQNFATVKAVGEGINDEKSDIQWSVPKGYSEGQYGYTEDVAGEFTNDVKQVQKIHFHNYNNSWFLDIECDFNDVFSITKHDIEFLQNKYGVHDFDEELERYEKANVKERPWLFYFVCGKVLDTNLKV